MEGGPRLLGVEIAVLLEQADGLLPVGLRAHADASLEFGESSSSKSTIIWSSVDCRFRSGLTFIAASTAAFGFFLASSHERTDALTKRRTRSGLFLIVLVVVRMVMPTMLAP